MTSRSDLTPETPTQLLTLAPSTQTQIDVFSDGVIQSVKSGEINPLTVLVQLRALAKASERILKEINSEIMNEADKYSGNEFEFSGNKITKTEHGTKYDFSKCNDTAWEMYDQKRASAIESMKDREAFLKALKSPMNVLDELTGEVIILNPPTKKSTSGLNVSIK